MSKLWVKIDYSVAATVVNGLKMWLDKLSELLDNASRDSDPEAGVCTRHDCPNRVNGE